MTNLPLGQRTSYRYNRSGKAVEIPVGDGFEFSNADLEGFKAAAKLGFEAYGMTGSGAAKPWTSRLVD